MAQTRLLGRTRTRRRELLSVRVQRTHVALPPPLVAALKQRAVADGRTVSDLVTRLLAEALAREASADRAPAGSPLIPKSCRISPRFARLASSSSRASPWRVMRRPGWRSPISSARTSSRWMSAVPRTMKPRRESRHDGGITSEITRARSVALPGSP
jgi:hypothetical protein